MFLMVYLHSIYNYADCSMTGILIVYPTIRTHSGYGRVNQITNPSLKVSFDFTFVTQTSAQRVVYFPYLLKRWPSMFSVSIYVAQSSYDKLINELMANNYPERLQYEIIVGANYSSYPINMLRNKAIQHCKTSHFWLTDMDMWPSYNLYDSLNELPFSLLEDKKSAIIVPAFEYPTIKKQCKSFATCAELVDAIVPSTKPDLLDCMNATECQIFRPGHRLHNYYFPAWYNMSYTPLVTQVKCFRGERQEPYVVVRKHKDLPLFDERFVDYGYNKVQWLELLRYSGYNFTVLTKAFAIDVPHPRTKYQTNYVNTLFANRGHNVTMKDLFESFLADLYTKPDHSVIRKC
ncbi:hypothetical protein WA158_001336 [Blastocystis sp. Blastoise]